MLLVGCRLPNIRPEAGATSLVLARRLESPDNVQPAELAVPLAGAAGRRP
jgi:hypothetical protein